MKVCVIGTGYVGLVTGVCLAEVGNRIICVDKDKEKIDMLKSCKVPIYENGLEELIRKNTESGNLLFSEDTGYGVRESDIIFICVGTPPLSTGRPDLSAIDEVARLIGKSINGYKIISNKSTVPIGTAKRIRKIIREVLSDPNKRNQYDQIKGRRA